MTVTRSIWIGDTKHDFSTMDQELKRDCALKMQLQMLKAIGRKPKDVWLRENPIYAEYWERL